MLAVSANHGRHQLFARQASGCRRNGMTCADTGCDWLKQRFTDVLAFCFGQNKQV